MAADGRVAERAADRRGEAHLWLVLEEALHDAVTGRGPDPAREARRTFRAIADALATVGAIDPLRADAIVAELDDALAVRGLVESGAFGGRALPAWDPASHPVRRRGDGWLEAEIEHHLDLVVDIDHVREPAIAERVLAVLTPTARALQACGALPHGPGRLADLAATFAAAGHRVDAGGGTPDRGWLGFLRDRPAPLTDALAPVASMRPSAGDARLGTMGREPVRLRRLAWSEALLQVEVEPPPLDDRTLGSLAWRCSVFDDAGRLHLGQAGLPAENGLVFRLRPGLMAGVSSLSIRLTRGAERVEEQVAL